MNPAGSQDLLGFQLKDRLSCPAPFHLCVEATWTVFGIRELTPELWGVGKNLVITVAQESALRDA